MTETRGDREVMGGSGWRSRLKSLYPVLLGLAILGLTAWLVVLFECKISG